MADFAAAVQPLLTVEGGLSNDPQDAGGKTKFGISQASFPGVDLDTLTVDDAKRLFHDHYWAFDQVASQPVANKLLKIVVNEGNHGGVKVIQRAAGLKLVDGVWGPATLEAINAQPETRMLLELAAQSAYQHAIICIANPVQSRFLLGWLRRDVS